MISDVPEYYRKYSTLLKIVILYKFILDSVHSVLVSPLYLVRWHGEMILTDYMRSIDLLKQKPTEKVSPPQKVQLIQPDIL